MTIQKNRSQVFRLAKVGLLVLFASAFFNHRAIAQIEPGVGWQAILSQDFHQVSGTVTVVDEDTLLVEDFTYDGEGIAVYFYLGATDSSADFANGLQIGDNLLGTTYDGSQPAFTIDLPVGETLDGYHAISVWCVPAGASFGSGTFQVPEPASVLLLVCGTLLSTNVLRRRSRQ